jgi:DNA-directed RNA polymerase specialized sigma24 family protein
MVLGQAALTRIKTVQSEKRQFNELITKQLIAFNKIICEVQKSDHKSIQQNKSKSDFLYNKTKSQAIDWLLFNLEEIREMALNNIPTGICSWNNERHSDSLDSFLERFILQSEYHLAIVNETKIAILLFPPEEYELYKMVYLNKMKYNDVAALIKISTKTIERRVLEIREDIFESLRKAGIELDNILAMKKKYKNIT